MREFNFSETYFKNFRRMFFIVFSVCVFVYLGYSLYTTDFDVVFSIIMTGIVILIYPVLSFIELPLIVRSMRKMKVVVYDDKIIKQCGKKEQSALWSEIEKVKITENVKGEIESIKLFHKKNKKIFMGAFDDMNNIANLIGENVNENVLVQRKRYKIDWNNPIVIITNTLVTFLIFVMIYFLGLMDYFITLIILGGGLVLLIWGPMRKGNINMKWLEIIMGVILILGGLFYMYFIMYCIEGRVGKQVGQPTKESTGK